MAKTITKSKRKGVTQMIKELQRFTNDTVLQEMNEIQQSCNNGKLLFKKQLRHCNAWVYAYVIEKDNTSYEYYLLKSYETIIAGMAHGCVYDWLRYVYGYTNTSAQHITKFVRDYAPDDAMVYRYYPV